MCVEREGEVFHVMTCHLLKLTYFLVNILIQNMEDLRLAQMFSANVQVYIWVNSPYRCRLHC